MASSTAVLARSVRPYSVREWKQATVLFAVYGVVHLVTAYALPEIALYPALAVTVAAVFFGGFRLLPVVYLAALAAEYLSGGDTAARIVMPLAALATAAAGGYLLRRGKVDPIFRRDRDVFSLVGALIPAAAIPPLFLALSHLATGTPYDWPAWLQDYVASFFSCIILVPFVLRWLAKTRFRRPPGEIVETLGVFSILVILSSVIFLQRTEAVIGIPLVYVLFVPLLIIALRLRPRFVTLALLVVSLFAIIGTALASPADIARELFQWELFLSMSAIIFLTITSLEEHRRANANRFLSQMATLQNVLARVNAESRAKNDFIAVLGHELRNPLSPVSSGIEFLRLTGERSEEELQTLDAMTRSMQTVTALLNDLLDVSRISEGKISMERQRVDLREVLRQAVISTDYHRKERHQRLVIDLPAYPLTVLGDPVRLEQVFSNLLTNASKYSGSGDTIELRARANDVVEVQVIDEGVGIRPEALESIFLPFQQIMTDARKSAGLGIGLALVRNFVHMHEGTVTAESEGLGRGSRFIVRLPRAPSHHEGSR